MAGGGGDGNCSLGTAIQSWEGWLGGGSPIAFITVPVGETADWNRVQVARVKLCMEWGLVEGPMTEAGSEGVLGAGFLGHPRARYGEAKGIVYSRLD